ncbi:MAG: GNAT family N-acetyltransferase [Rubrivivax sp.]|jgi:ribosomal protein S18 acetylase RimI-like enzyme
MHIARLKPADALAYRALMLQAYALAADAFTSTAEERALEPEAYWVHRIGAGDEDDADGAGNLALGAWEAGALVGTVAVEFSIKPKTRHQALVIGMYVAPGCRRGGVGRALLAQAVAAATARPGVRAVSLTVTEGNEPALSLYRSAGFQPWGVEPMAILTPGGFKAKVHMWLPVAEAGPVV